MNPSYLLDKYRAPTIFKTMNVTAIGVSEVWASLHLVFDKLKRRLPGQNLLSIGIWSNSSWRACILSWLSICFGGLPNVGPERRIPSFLQNLRLSAISISLLAEAIALYYSFFNSLYLFQQTSIWNFLRFQGDNLSLWNQNLLDAGTSPALQTWDLL